MRYAVRFTNIDVLATVVSGRSLARGSFRPRSSRSRSRSCSSALARPHVERTFLKERATVILVVDTSRSMQAEDVEPTRLGAAQEAVRTFLDDVPGPAERRVSSSSRARRRSRRRRRRITSSFAPRWTRSTRSSSSAERRSATRCETAVELGKQRDGRGAHRGRGDRRGRPARARTHLAQATACGGREPRVDPLPLRRRADARDPPAARGRRARPGSVHPGVHDRARHARGRRSTAARSADPFGPGTRTRRADPGAARSRDAARDRRDDGRRVLGGARRADALENAYSKAGLEARAASPARARSPSSSSRSPARAPGRAACSASFVSPRLP